MSNIIGLNEMFGIPDSQNEVVDLPIRDLTPRREHKFRPSPASKLQMIKESIKEFGVLEPILVRPAEEIKAYKINGKYEILAGHQRTSLSKELGKKTVPGIIMTGLTEDEAEQIVTETNLQRDWGELSHSERAAVLAAHYDAQKRSGSRKEVLEEINSYLKEYSNPVESMAEGGLSPGATAGVREVADEYDLSKDTIARYIRIDTLIEDIKLMLDDGEIPFKAAVQLSYINETNQLIFVDVFRRVDNAKLNEDKAKAIRNLQIKGKLTEASVMDVLQGKKEKKPGKPKPYKISGTTIKKYFPDEQDEKKIGEVIDAALKMYFENTVI